MGIQQGGQEIRIGYNINGSSCIGLAFPNNSNNGWVYNGNSSGQYIDPYQWYHIAVVKNGSTLKLYLNGQEIESFSNVNFDFTTTGTLKIGANSWSYNGDGFYIGYFDDIRIIKGKALYTSNFTPSNAPLSIPNGPSGNVSGNVTFNDLSYNNNGSGMGFRILLK